MTTKKCACGAGKGEKDEASCAVCDMDDIFFYWCSSCNRSVAEKRCPYCGLKAQKKRSAVPR
jgi:predicted RNA-binding protein with PUA domain